MRKLCSRQAAAATTDKSSKIQEDGEGLYPRGVAVAASKRMPQLGTIDELEPDPDCSSVYDGMFQPDRSLFDHILKYIMIPGDTRARCDTRTIFGRAGEVSEV